MKTISLNVQKILSYIPVVNGCIVFLFIYNWIAAKPESAQLGKTLLRPIVILFCFAAVFLIARVLLGADSGSWQFLQFVLLYIAPLAFGMSLITAQAKIGLK